MITEELLSRKPTRQTVKERREDKSLDDQPFINVYGETEAPYLVVMAGLSWKELVGLVGGLNKSQAYLTIKHNLMVEKGKRYKVSLAPLKSAVYAESAESVTPFAQAVANIIDYPNLELVPPDIDGLRQAESLKRYHKNKEKSKKREAEKQKQFEAERLKKTYEAALKAYRLEFAAYKAGESQVRPNITDMCRRYSEMSAVKLHRWKLTELIKAADIGYEAPEKFKITSKQLTIAKAALNSGKTYAEVAAKLHLDQHGLNYYMRRRGIVPLRQPRKKRFKVTQLELFYKDMYEEGLTAPQVMDKYALDISRAQFLRFMKAYEFNIAANDHIYERHDIDNVLTGENPLLYIQNPSNVVHNSQLVVLNGKFVVAALRVFAMWQIVGRNVHKVKGFDVPLADDELYAVAMCSSAATHFGPGKHRIAWPVAKRWERGEYRIISSLATDSLLPKVAQQHARSLPLPELKHFLLEFERAGKRAGLFAKSFTCTPMVNVLDKVK